MMLYPPPILSPYFEAELRAATQTQRLGDDRTAWQHLERAHVLGQRWAVSHTLTHLRMAAFGLRRRDLHEVLGQVPRIIAGFFMSLLGRVPNGNTGGANVPAEQPMPIPADLQALLALAERPASR